MSTDDQIGSISDEWQSLMGEFYIPSFPYKLSLPRRFKAAFRNLIESGYPEKPLPKPINVGTLMSSYAWPSPGEYLQIGQIVAQDDCGQNHYFPVCVSLVPREEWVSRQEDWLKTVAPRRLGNCKDDKSRYTETESISRLNSRVSKARELSDFYLLNQDFVVLDDPDKLRFMFWRSRD